MKKRNFLLGVLGLAYVIDRLSKRKEELKEPELTMELKYTPGPPREPIKFESPKDVLCPYCNYRFAELPKRSQKCPECKKYIYRAKDYENKVYQLITEEQHNKDVEIDAKYHWKDSEKYARSTLRRYQKGGVKQVRISSAGDASCPACREQSGKVYLIEDALEKMPIPCKDCTFDLHGEHASVGWCRCVYTPIIEGLEDELEKILQTPEVPKEQPDKGVFNGAHSGSYENSIRLYLKDNNTDKIKDLIQEIFKNFDDVISGRVKLGQFDQEIGFYIYEKKQFGKRIGDIFIRETKAALKNNEIPKARSLLDIIAILLQNIEDNHAHLMSDILRAKIFRTEKAFNNSWQIYNEALKFCKENKDMSVVYSEMGEQLLEENKIKQAVGTFLYALSLTENFSPASAGLKRALKLMKMHERYETLVNITKNVKDFDELQKNVDDVLSKSM